MKAPNVRILWVGLQFLSAALPAQTYTPNPVGYVNMSYAEPDTLIGNPLNSGSNTLNEVFPDTLNPHIPDGTTISTWDAGMSRFQPPSTYHIGIGWDIDYLLPPGEGALLHATAPFVNMFVGSVLYEPGTDVAPLTPPARSAGLYLLSSLSPRDSRTFEDIIGRPPLEGEYVMSLGVPSQTYVKTTFQNGDWNNGVPMLNIGQAAFFNLVPEPNSTVLVCLALATASVFWRFSRR